MIWFVIYYFISLIGCWVVLGYEEKEIDSDDWVEFAFISILAGWVALPMTFFVWIGSELRKKKHEK